MLLKTKKGIAIITCLAMTLGFFPTVGQAEENVTVTLEEKCDTIGERSNSGYIPINKTILNPQDLQVGKKKQSAYRATIPSAYDAREEGILSEIRDQKTIGNCWAYAVLGVSEANIRKKGYESEPDLSEYHISYSLYNKTLDPLGLTIGDNCKVKNMDNSVYSWGGNDYFATSTLARWQGAVEEEDAPMTELFSANDKNISVIPREEVLNKDSYHLKNVEYIYITESNRDLIKEKIMEYGSGTISYYSQEGTADNKYSNTGKNNYTAYYCDDTTKSENHEVMVVGWDDNYAVSNFNASCRPTNPGAWLVRNSWGDCNDMNGYFWISYEDVLLNAEINTSAEISFFELEKSDNYEHNYQYDGGVPLRYIKGCKYVANVFTAQENEKVQAVSFYTQERNVNYEIKLYKIQDESKPTTGTLLGEAITGKCSERGYHTIHFSENGVDDVSLHQGDIFSVVLSLENSGGANAYFTYESKIGHSELEETITGGTNQSLYYNGVKWVDFAQTYDANFCIKAFTTTQEELPTPTPTPTAKPTPTPTAKPTPTPTAKPTPTPTVTPKPTPTPTVMPTPTATATSTPIPTAKPTPIGEPTPTGKPTPTATPTTNPTSTEILTLEPTSVEQVIVKKLTFSPKTKKLKVGKKLSLKKYLKITKKNVGVLKLKYEFTKKKYKTYASLTSKGVLKAKKKGRKKTVYVRVRALDGSGKSAKIKIKIT